jgi:hypothetical protein
MLSVTYKPLMLSVIVLNVVMLSVVAPIFPASFPSQGFFNKDPTVWLKNLILIMSSTKP